MKTKILLILFSVLLISGCGKSESSKTIGTAEKPYKIIWYSFGSPQKDLQKVIEKVNDYTRDKIGVIIDLKLDIANYDKKMKIKMASGEQFDLCFTSGWTNNYKSAVSKGYFLPLNDLFNKYGKEMLDVINPIFIEGTKINGKNYSVPINREAAYQHVFIFNKKYIDKYDIKLGKSISWEELDKIFTLIHNKEPGIKVFYPWSYYLMQDQDYIINSNIPGCVEIKDGKPKVVNQFRTSDFVGQMKWYHKFYKKGFIPNDIIADGNSLNLKAGNWFCTIHAYGPVSDESINEECGFPVKCVPMFEKPIVGNTVLLGAMIGISSTSERPDLVMKFLNLLNTDKYLRNLLGYGMEDVHYKMISDNRIKLLPESANYNLNQWTVGNLFITYLLSNDPENKWELYKKWNDSAIVSSIAGFSFDTEPVKMELTAINNISNEFYKGLFLGAYDPDIYIDKMINKMNNAGLDKVLNEMQRQIDQWWSDKQETNKN